MCVPCAPRGCGVWGARARAREKGTPSEKRSLASFGRVGERRPCVAHSLFFFSVAPAPSQLTPCRPSTARLGWRAPPPSDWVRVTRGRGVGARRLGSARVARRQKSAARGRGGLVARPPLFRPPHLPLPFPSLVVSMLGGAAAAALVLSKAAGNMVVRVLFFFKEKRMVRVGTSARSPPLLRSPTPLSLPHQIDASSPPPPLGGSDPSAAAPPPRRIERVTLDRGNGGAPPPPPPPGA